MRTFSREAFLEAKAQWERGRFGPEWQRIRRIAAERGFIFPPSGSVHDNRDAVEPSQRAIVYHALETRPEEVERIVRRSGSWSDVVNGIFGMEARLGVEAFERQRDIDFEREEPLPNQPYRRVGFQPVCEIAVKVADSIGVPTP